MSDRDKRLSQFKADLGKMDTKFDQQAVDDAWHQEMDENHEWWEKMEYVDKPETYVRRDNKIENMRRGFIVDTIGTPMNNMVIIDMDKPQLKTSTGIYLTDVRAQPDVNTGTVVSLCPGSDYDVSVGDHVCFDLRAVRHRMYKDGIYLIIYKEGVLGIYDN